MTKTLKREDIDNSVYRCQVAIPVEFELSCMIHRGCSPKKNASLQ